MCLRLILENSFNHFLLNENRNFKEQLEDISISVVVCSLRMYRIRNANSVSVAEFLGNRFHGYSSAPLLKSIRKAAVSDGSVEGS